MKKILVLGLLGVCCLNGNVRAMEIPLAASPSDQLIPEQRVIKAQKILPSVVKAYGKFLNSSATKSEKAELYNFIMLVKHCSREEINEKISPMLRKMCGRGGTQGKNHGDRKKLLDLLEDLTVKAAMLEDMGRSNKSFCAIKECLPYLNVISILNANGKTLAETFSESLQPEAGPNLGFCLDADMEGELAGRSEEDYIRRVNELNVLYGADMITFLRVRIDKRCAKLLSDNLDLKCCSGRWRYKSIEFYGSEDEPLDVSMIPFDKIESEMRINDIFLKNAKVKDDDVLCDFLKKHEVTRFMLENADSAMEHGDANSSKLSSVTSIKAFYHDKMKSPDVAYSWVKCLPESVADLALTFNGTVAAKPRGEVAKEALRRLRNVETFQMCDGREKLDIDTLLCVILHPTVNTFRFCGNDVFIHPDDDYREWNIKKAIVNSGIDVEPDAPANVMMPFLKYRGILDDQDKYKSLITHILTSVKDLRKTTAKADIIAATSAFRSAIEAKYDDFKARFDRLGEKPSQKDIARINDDFRGLIQRECDRLRDRLQKPLRN